MSNTMISFYKKQPPTVANLWKRYLLALCINTLVPASVSVGSVTGLSSLWFSYLILLNLLFLSLIYRWVNQQNPQAFTIHWNGWRYGSCLANFVAGALLLIAVLYFVKEIPFHRIRALVETPATLWWFWSLFALGQLAECLRCQSLAKSIGLHEE